MLIEIPVAVAELFDKISILEIKLKKIEDLTRQQHAANELEKLLKVARLNQIDSFLTEPLYEDLKAVNETLWDVCEARRASERIALFDHDFIEQSRLEYKTNDQRALVKQKINDRFNSAIVEVKSYDKFNRQPS
jgi:hypothetical protein